MEESESLSWSEVLRIIQSVPCNDPQLQRLGDTAQVDGDTRVLELADTLTLTGQCWASHFGCPIEVNTAAGFFAQADKPAPPPDASGEDPDYALAFEFTPRPGALRYDCVLWGLDAPMAAAELERACQKIRAALNVNGCLLLSIPVRVGVRPTAAEVDAFYAELGAAPLALPQHVSASLEASGFEPLSVEFTPNRQALARYRMIESALERCRTATDAARSRWKREVKLFLKEGGVSFFPSAVFTARRWEYVDGS